MAARWCTAESGWRHNGLCLILSQPLWWDVISGCKTLLAICVMKWCACPSFELLLAIANTTPCVLPSPAQEYKPYIRPQAISPLSISWQLTCWFTDKKKWYFSENKIVCSFLNMSFVKLSGGIFFICSHIVGYRQHVPIPRCAMINQTNKNGSNSQQKDNS